MADQPQENGVPPSDTPTPPTSWHDERRERREERRASRGGAWTGGAILILLGIFFLLQNLTGFKLNNWWALFILIPAIGSFGNAFRAYQNSGHVNGEVRGSLVSGLILTTVAAIFLFNLSWTLFGPIILIIIGGGLLINAALPK